MVLWIEPKSVAVSEELLDVAGGHPLVALTLARRGIVTPDAARPFLNPEHYTPASATDLPEMELALERIWRALKTGEHIAVWGDFDVDGQTATALLVEGLRWLSSRVKTERAIPISYQVPLRHQGHGVYVPAIDKLLSREVTLLITCDTGVDASSAVAYATSRGCDVIVTDHHDLPARLPTAAAILNPKRLSTDHPLRHLPGVGVAYKLVEGLFEQAGHGDRSFGLLDLVALGIVADVAIQASDVRFLLQRGLRVLRGTDRVGLRALAEKSEVYLEGLTEEHIAYQLAPRLNASGRLGDANQSVELLLTQDLTQARVLATEMDALNYERRLITGQVLAAAQEQVEHNPSLLDYHALVLAGHNWHAGVLGPVAGRMAEQFDRPTILLSVTSDGLARGSARSVPGCDIRAALERTADLLKVYGGHPGAAGLVLDFSNLESFRKALSRAVTSVWDSDAAAPGLQIDAYVLLDQLSLELVGQLERLAPFGPGNPSVKLVTQNVQIEEATAIGRNAEHLRLVVADERGEKQMVLWWQGADQALPEGPFDLAYTARTRDYRGDAQLQVEWISARPHKASVPVVSETARTIVDWRNAVDPFALVATILGRDVTVWAEGEDASTLEVIHGTDRFHLAPASALMIWTSPPGPAELDQALQTVSPNTVYLLAVQPPTADMGQFLERLVGMLKHDLNTRAGNVNLSRMAAALGQRVATVRTGVEWLVARGQLRVVQTAEDSMIVRPGGEPVGAPKGAQLRLQRLLDETAAYRRHFRTAPAEDLRILDLA